MKGENLAETRAWFKSALGDAPNASVRALKTGMMFQQIIIADGKGVVSPYLFSANTGFSPCLEMDATCDAFPTFVREFELLWELQGAE